MPIAAPPSAAAMIGPAPSPHENALRFSLRLDPLLLRFSPELRRFSVELLRLEVRLSLRVAIRILLVENPCRSWRFNGQGRDAVPFVNPPSRSVRRTAKRRSRVPAARGAALAGAPVR